jgi:hypothetical protein
VDQQEGGPPYTKSYGYVRFKDGQLSGVSKNWDRENLSDTYTFGQTLYWALEKLTKEKSSVSIIDLGHDVREEWDVKAIHIIFGDKALRIDTTRIDKGPGAGQKSLNVSEILGEE